MNARGLCGKHYYHAAKADSLPPRKRWLEHADIRKWHINSANGYVYGFVTVDGVRKSVLQHRMVMESFLGRPLIKGENVHHINGDRTDNRIENLELWNTRQPKGQRVQDKLEWAREIIRLYG